jgi:hypothetical protein
MKKVKVGIRTGEKGLSFFGDDEVNALIADGWVVRAVNAGDAIVEKVPSEQGKEVFALAGADIVVVLDEPK